MCTEWRKGDGDKMVRSHREGIILSDHKVNLGQLLEELTVGWFSPCNESSLCVPKHRWLPSLSRKILFCNKYYFF